MTLQDIYGFSMKSAFQQVSKNKPSIDQETAELIQ